MKIRSNSKSVIVKKEKCYGDAVSILNFERRIALDNICEEAALKCGVDPKTISWEIVARPYSQKRLSTGGTFIEERTAFRKTFVFKVENTEILDYEFGAKTCGITDFKDSFVHDLAAAYDAKILQTGAFKVSEANMEFSDTGRSTRTKSAKAFIDNKEIISCKAQSDIIKKLLMERKKAQEAGDVTTVKEFNQKIAKAREMELKKAS